MKKTIEDLTRERNDAAKKVAAWTGAEGAAGQLRHAPAWAEFEAAENALYVAMMIGTAETTT